MTADDIIRRALDEDAPWGDLTSDAFLPVGSTARATLGAREEGVLSGIHVFSRVFELVDPACEVGRMAEDGDRFAAGDALASMGAASRAIVEDTFSWQRIVERQLDVYGELLERRR